MGTILKSPPHSKSDFFLRQRIFGCKEVPYSRPRALLYSMASHAYLQSVDLPFMQNSGMQQLPWCAVVCPDGARAFEQTSSTSHETVEKYV
jgi:hypothetical protein